MTGFLPLTGLKILGLASGGGQQGPTLAALGADVTIFDNSEKQLLQDRKIGDRYGLPIKTIQGDMRDLSVFPGNEFDLIFNPCSVLFVDNLQQVWEECFRVLKPGGVLMTGLINPVSFQIAEIDDSFRFVYQRPYSDLHSLKSDEIERHKSENEPFVFGHSLTDQIGGQLKAGFMLTDMYEDNWNGEYKIDQFFPSFIATRALKGIGQLLSIKQQMLTAGDFYSRLWF